MTLDAQNPDEQLLSYLSEGRFLLLTRQHIQKLLALGARRTNQRLSRLIDRGWLSRRKPAGPYSPPLVLYSIGRNAAEVLDQNHDSVIKQMTRARAIKDASLKHLYLTSEALIQFITAGRVYPDYRLIQWIAFEYTAFDERQSFGIRPDAYVEYEKAGKLASCFIEIDLGTEKGQPIRDKIAAYHDYQRSGKFRRHFGGDSFRVLFVVEKPPRSEFLRKLFPSETLWVATIDDVRGKPLFEPYWITRSYANVGLEFSPTPTQSVLPLNAPVPDDPLPPPPDPPPQARLPLSAATPARRKPIDDLDEEPWRRPPRIPFLGYVLGAVGVFIVGIIIGMIYSLLVLAQGYLAEFFRSINPVL